MTVFVKVLVSFILLSCFQLLRTRYRKGLHDIPGPFIASFTNLWKVMGVYDGNMPRQNVAVHEQYGSVVRIGPNHVSFASPQAFSIIHSSRQAYAKSDFYEVGSPVYRGGPLLNLFSIQDVNYHASLRKNIGGLYTKASVKDFEPQVDSCVALFMSQLAKLSKERPATLDMSLWLHLFAFDCLGEVNLSRKIGFLEGGRDVGGMIAAADRIFYMVGLFTQAPVLQLALRILRSVVKAEKAEPLLPFTFNEVQARQKSREPASDLLDKLLKLHEAQPDKVTIRELTAAIFINLMAGHDVLAITLRAVFYYLGRNPRVTSKLRSEINSAGKEYPISSPIPYSRVSTLPYLDAVLQETLRIHPNTGLILERKVPREGAVIDSFKLPGGTIVGVNAWVLHRNKSIFGEDVNVFRPERWLNANDEQRLEMNRHLFSFGAGPYTCIGKNIAMMQMGKLVVEFYRHFDAQLAHPEREWKVHGSWVTKQSEMDMVVTPLSQVNT